MLTTKPPGRGKRERGERERERKRERESERERKREKERRREREFRLLFEFLQFEKKRYTCRVPLFILKIINIHSFHS